ncbi:MAG: hypothetical protein MJA82_13155 [Clostridia bacterium]|nr:hypothetical protein [Clostridia bacterium]
MKEQIKSTRGKRVIKIIIAVIVLVHIIPFPINKQFETFEIKLDDDTYMDECTVSIKGKYYFNFFTKDKFVGKIIVSKYPLTNWEMNSIKVTRLLKGDDAYLSYRNKTYNEDDKRWHTERYALGYLMTNTLFNKIAIGIIANDDYPDNSERKGVEGWWGTADGYMIVPSAKTRDEAIEKINEWSIFD